MGSVRIVNGFTLYISTKRKWVLVLHGNHNGIKQCCACDVVAPARFSIFDEHRFRPHAPFGKQSLLRIYTKKWSNYYSKCRYGIVIASFII